MYVRQKKNSSGSTSIQIISKNSGRYKVVETIGCSQCEFEIEQLLQQAKNRILELEPNLFDFLEYYSQKQKLTNKNIRVWLETRIKAHILISFVSYAIYKEFERKIKISNLETKFKLTFDHIKTMYGYKTLFGVEALEMDEIQQKIYDAVYKEWEFGCPMRKSGGLPIMPAGLTSLFWIKFLSHTLPLSINLLGLD